MKIFSKILMLAALVGLFCSCDKDDDNSSSSTPKEVVISYSYTNTDDFFSLMNVNVEYLDAKGALVKKDITKNWSYEETVSYSSAPAEYKFIVTYSAAVSGLEQPKDEYTTQSVFKANVYKVMPDGETKSVGVSTIEEKTPKKWTATTINDYLNLHKNAMSIPFECSLEENN